MSMSPSKPKHKQINRSQTPQEFMLKLEAFIELKIQASNPAAAPPCPIEMTSLRNDLVDYLIVSSAQAGIYSTGQ